MTDADLLEQVKLGKLWVETTRGSTYWPWHWKTLRTINAIPVNRDHLMTLLNRLEELLEAAGEIERLRGENAVLMDNAICARNVALRAEIERLRAALEWFADETNYVDGSVEVDGLSVARAALKKDEGEVRAGKVGTSIFP